MKKKRTRTKTILPKKRSVKSDSIEEYSFLFHGEKKIGKTTLLAQEPNNLFLEYDPIQKSLEIYQVPIREWDTVNEVADELERGGHDFTTCTHDGVDIMYQLCLETVCAARGVGHPHDSDDFGSTWNAVKRAFGGTINRYLKMDGVATRFICHSVWKEIKTRVGKTDRLCPTLTGQAEEVLVGLVDGWFAYIYDGDERVLVIRGNEQIAAGHRINHRFLTPDDRQVREIPMGDSEFSAYDNFQRAFNNQQEFVDLMERREQQAKPKKAAKRKPILKQRKNKRS